MTLSFETIWSKPLIAESGGETDLMIRITAGAAPVSANQRAPVDVAFIIDRSGSMGGGKLETAKQEAFRSYLFTSGSPTTLPQAVAGSAVMRRVTAASARRRGSSDQAGSR